MAFHGARRRLEGVVTATFTEGRRRNSTRPGATQRSVVVSGEHTLDIRHFDMSMPAMPLLKIYPDVRLRLHIEADEEVAQGAVPAG